MKVPGGYVSTAPHRPESVPRSCWTCIHHELVHMMTTCPYVDRPNHTKIGMEPCERYELDGIWLMVDWFYPEPRRERA